MFLIQTKLSTLQENNYNTHGLQLSMCYGKNKIFSSEMQTTVSTARSINTEQLIYVNGSYQLAESLEGTLASKTKVMIDDCHFIKAFISS